MTEHKTDYKKWIIRFRKLKFLKIKFLKEILRGKLFRHPIHVMLVHFPSALFPTSFLFDLLAWLTEDALFSMFAFYALMIGILGGILASVFGAIEYFRLPHVHMAWQKASLHALLNIIWLFFFILFAWFRARYYPNIAIPTIFQLIALGACVFGLFYSNYLGGELVFRHKLGTFENG